MFDSMRLFYLVLAFLVLAPSKAHAASIVYDLRGTNSISFTLNTNPTPGRILIDGFVIEDVSLLLNGEFVTDDIGFVVSNRQGGLILLGFGIDLAGPQLFAGTLAEPIMLEGSFELTELTNASSRYTLNSSIDISAVPEPTVWTMMLGSFAGIGWLLRRKGSRSRSPSCASVAA